MRFEAANALALPFEDGPFDAATVGFGARNFSDLERGLREMARVVRPGGRVVVLEITTPRRPPLSTFFELWFDRLVPALGRLAGDRQAYSYLPDSVRRFPGPEELAALMWRCGLDDVRYLLTAGGIIALHVGTVTMSVALRAGGRRGRRGGRLAADGARRGADGRAGGRPRVVLAQSAGETIAAGGKRLRPLLVCLAAGVPPPENDGLVRAAVAVELVHGATLVHDDVLDGSPLRRGRPTVVASGGRAARHRDRRPAVLARVRRARALGSVEAVRVLVEGQRRARLRRADAARRRLARRRFPGALSRALPAEDRGPVPRRLRAGRAVRDGGRGGGARVIRRADRIGVPDPRRRPRRLWSARSEPASRRAPTCSTGR